MAMTENEKKILNEILLHISNSIHGTRIEQFAKEGNKEKENIVRESKIELDGLIKSLTGF